ncbi:MAG TPA: thermonuclease family protein [Pirellulaceae bacterium]|nr:thermonuclease family protein [Pirellulaceae bacterium]
MRIKHFCLVVLLVLTFQDEGFRTWRASNSGHSIVAEFGELRAGTVYLITKEDEIISILVGELSDADQEYVANRSKPVEQIEGRVIGVADGDTFTLLVGDEQRRIRLEGIDAPEDSQQFSAKSKEALADLVFEKTVVVEVIGTDKYGRTLGHVFVTDDTGTSIWVNRRLVQDGWSWHFREHSRSRVLNLSERHARSQKAGLWADTSQIVAPWEFRERQRIAQAEKAKERLDAQKEVENLAGQQGQPQGRTVYITDTGDKYHLSNCRSLRSSKTAVPIENAKRQGYSPCGICKPGN